MNLVLRLTLIVCLVTVPFTKIHAHGPFDSSAQLLILDGSFETVVVLGMDGARQVLSKAGMSETETSSVLAVRGPSSQFTLSPEIAPRFLEVIQGEMVLKPGSFRVITDGLEASFVASYGGIPVGPIELRARYFNGVASMKPGVFTVLDENHNIKSESVFAQSKLQVSVVLQPAAKDRTPTNPVAGLPEPPPANSVPPAVTASHVEPQSKAPSKLWSIGIAVLVLSGVWVLVRRLTGSR